MITQQTPLFYVTPGDITEEDLVSLNELLLFLTQHEENDTQHEEND